MVVTPWLIFSKYLDEFKNTPLSVGSVMKLNALAGMKIEEASVTLVASLGNMLSERIGSYTLSKILVSFL
jgi:hypothetical protein